MRSPHTSYRWRGERVIEKIKWMGIIRRPWLTRASGGNSARTPGLHPHSLEKCHGILMTTSKGTLFRLYTLASFEQHSPDTRMIKSFPSLCRRLRKNETCGPLDLWRSTASIKQTDINILPTQQHFFDNTQTSTISLYLTNINLSCLN